MWLAPVAAARVASNNGVCHAPAWPLEVDDALDVVDGVLKDGSFHAMEDVWAPDVADGVSKDGLFHVDGVLRALCDILGASKGGTFHAHLPPCDSRQGANRILKGLRPFSTAR